MKQGTLGILRSFLGTASTNKDRVRAVSLGTSGLTTGYSLGPVLQVNLLYKITMFYRYAFSLSKAWRSS